MFLLKRFIYKTYQIMHQEPDIAQIVDVEKIIET